MKPCENLRFNLAEIKDDDVVMNVHLYRTAAKYWHVFVERSPDVDMVAHLFEFFATRFGFDEKLEKCFAAIPRKRRCAPKICSASAMFFGGKFFPDRDSVMKIIEEVLLPCWRYAVEQITACGSPGDSWMRMTLKAETKHYDMENDSRSADV